MKTTLRIDFGCVILSMRFKYIIPPVALIICFVAVYGKNKAKITLHLNNLPLHSSSLVCISMGDSVYYNDTVGLSKTVMKLNFSNPFPVMIMANNILPSNKLFWVHEGVYDVYYDMETYDISFENSSLNKEYVEIKTARDSINYLYKDYKIRLLQAMDDFYRKKDTTAKARMDAAFNNFTEDALEIKMLDSLSSDSEYRYYTEHTTSFLALNFINSSLNCSTIDREKLLILLTELHKKLKKYPMYASCKKNLMNPYYVPPTPKGCVRPAIPEE